MNTNGYRRTSIGFILVLVLVIGDVGQSQPRPGILVRQAAAQSRGRAAPARKRPAPSRPLGGEATGAPADTEASTAAPEVAPEASTTGTAFPQPQPPAPPAPEVAPEASTTGTAFPQPQPPAPPAPEARPTSVPSAAAALPLADEDPGARRATLERLRARHDELRDAVFRSRARRETLEQALFSTRLALRLVWDANRNYTLARAELRVDGARVWDSGERPVGDEPVTLAPRAVPPGPHILGLRIEVRSRDNPKLGYTMEQSYTLILAEGKMTEVEITVDEDGSLPSYNPDIEIDVSVRD